MQEWLYPLGIIGLISIWLLFGPLPVKYKLYRNAILGGWLLKVTMSIAFHWVYSVYYSDKTTGDTWKFFSDAEKLYQCAENKEMGRALVLLGKDNPESEVASCFKSASYWYNNEEISIVNDTRSIIRVNFLLYPFSGGNYLIHLLFFSSLAFAGMCIIFLMLQEKFPGNPTLVNWLVAFGIPSISFWTGGILKESLMLPLFAILVQLINNEKSIQKKIIPMLFIIGILTQVKFYIGVTAFLALGGMLFFHSLRKLKVGQKLLITIGTTVLLFISLDRFVPKRIPEMMAKKQNDFVNLARGGDYWTLNSGDTIYIPNPKNAYLQKEGRNYLQKNVLYHSWVNLSIKDTLKSEELLLQNCLATLKPSGSAFTIEPIQPSWKGLIIALPKAIVNAAFRPFLNELKNPFTLLSFLENYFLLGLLFCVFLERILHRKSLAYQKNQAVFAILFCIILLGLIGMTTPVTGALVRYRLPVIWLMAIFSAMNWNNLVSLLKKQNKHQG